MEELRVKIDHSVSEGGDKISRSLEMTGLFIFLTAMIHMVSLRSAL